MLENARKIFQRVAEAKLENHAEVTDTPTSGIIESVSLQKKAGDKTNWLGGRN